MITKDLILEGTKFRKKVKVTVYDEEIEVRPLTDVEIAKLLGKKDLKNEKRADFIQGIVPDYVSTRNIIDEICKKLSIEPNEDIYKMILS